MNDKDAGRHALGSLPEEEEEEEKEEKDDAHYRTRRRMNMSPV